MNPTAWHWMILWGIAMALGAHALLPFVTFPMVDDFAYAPLAEAWIDPSLYPRDDQLHAFTNHAWAYVLVYWLAKATLGVGAGFWIAAVILTIASVLAMSTIMRRFGVNGFALPLAVAVGLMVTIPGVGRGVFGGLVSGFFHHQWIALALVMWAFAATLGRRPALAGLALGLAAYAQPMSAFHGALAIAVASAVMGRAGARQLAVTAGVAILIALPFEYSMIASVLNQGDAPVPAVRLIEDAYLFRAPHHYSLESYRVLLGWGYLGLGLISALALRQWQTRETTIALGLLGGLGALHGVSTVFYFITSTSFLPIYVLDATRSSPLFFVLSATLFAAALERRVAAGLVGLHWREAVLPALAAALAFGLMILNAQPTGWFFALAGVLVLSSPTRTVPRAALAVTLVLPFVMMTDRINLRPQADVERIELFDWADRETARDALFITPPGMQEFRLFARRSIYVDFKLFSVAQPQQAWLTRTRLEQTARPSAEALTKVGWPAMAYWDRDYIVAAECARMASLLIETGANYFVRPIADALGGEHSSPNCAGNLQVAFENSAFAVYHGLE